MKGTLIKGHRCSKRTRLVLCPLKDQEGQAVQGWIGGGRGRSRVVLKHDHDKSSGGWGRQFVEENTCRKDSEPRAKTRKRSILPEANE